MIPATGHFASTAAIATALQSQLQKVTLPAGGNAFQRVELFDSENLVEAFQQLMVSEQTIAVVVPLTARWETQSAQRKVLTRRVLPVAVLISDRMLGNRTAALFGGNSNQGAFALSALATPYVVGQLIDNPSGVVSVPAHESVLNLKRAGQQDLPGRACVALELDCKGGWLEAPLAAGPTL